MLHKLWTSFRKASPALSLLAVLVGIQAWNPSTVQTLRLKAFDFFQRHEPAVLPADRTVIIDIDDESLDKIGQWPWDRATMAKLIAAIGDGKPSVIGLDIVFPEHDRLSPPRIAERWGETVPAFKDLTGLPDTDVILSETLRNYPVVGAVAAAPIRGANPLPKASVAMLGEDPGRWMPRFEGAIASLPVLSKVAKGAGNITIETGVDGVVRQMPILLKAENAIVPALALDMLRVSENERTIIAKTENWGISAAMTANTKVALDGTGRLWLRFAPHDPSRFVPAVDILTGKFDTTKLAGRRVIIGSSAFGLWDLRAIPLGYSMPGVEIQAQALDGVVHGTHLYRPYWLLGIEILVTIITGLTLMALLNRVGARWTLVAHLFLVFSLALISAQLFSLASILFDAAYTIFASSILYLALIYAGHTASEVAREKVTGAFKKYLSPVLVERLAKDAHKLNLGGETREISILFADIQGFTGLSEKMEGQPERFTALVNTLLDAMAGAVHAHNGTIDKFMGDNVMAFWNAPLDQPDHALLACKAAIAMQEALRKVNEKLASDPEWADIFKDQRPLAAGIGINTGPCTVGNFGSRNRFDYSAIGDNVNMASRLEGAAKRYGITALISEETMQQAGPGILGLPLGDIRIRGRRGAVNGYAVLGLAGEDACVILAAHSQLMAVTSPRELEATTDRCLNLRPDAAQLYEAIFESKIELMKAA